MNKLKDLRQTLLDAHLGLEAEKLTVFTEKGNVQHFYSRENDGSNNKFKKTYSAKIFIADYAKDVDTVLFVTAQWLTKNEPGHNPDAIDFEVDILNHKSVDLLITVKDINEVVNATTTNDGVYLGTCPPEHLDPILRKSGVVNVIPKPKTP